MRTKLAAADLRSKVEDHHRHARDGPIDNPPAASAASPFRHGYRTYSEPAVERMDYSSHVRIANTPPFHGPELGIPSVPAP